MRVCAFGTPRARARVPAPQGYTLCTVLLDVMAGRMTVYRGNPGLGLVGSVLSLASLMPL